MVLQMEPAAVVFGHQKVLVLEYLGLRLMMQGEVVLQPQVVTRLNQIGLETNRYGQIT